MALDLDALKELAERASAGPWKVSIDKHPWALPATAGYGAGFPARTGEHTERRICTEWHHPQLKQPAGIVNLAVGVASEPGERIHMVSISEEDAAFIAASREAVPALIAEVERLREALRELLDAPALSAIRKQVAGWNGEGQEGGPYERHPSRLGARIETNCGRIYELDEIMQRASALLSPTPAPKED